MNYLDLAGLLEQAAKALREADAALQTVNLVPDGDRRIPKLKGYGELSPRTKKVLRGHHGEKPVRTVSELCNMTSDEFLDRVGAGATAISEIRALLAENDLSLLDEQPD